MAQAMPEKKPHDSTEMEGKNTNLSFKFNAQAPAFVPRTQPQVPISGYIYPYIHYLGCGNVGSNWYYVSEQEPVHFVPNTNVSAPSSPKHCLSDDMTDKIVEYQFSEMSLVASETLMKHMHKNPDGYVPISVIASSKKLKSIVTNYGLVAQALRSSSKLVVSNDGKKLNVSNYSLIETKKTCRVIQIAAYDYRPFFSYDRVSFSNFKLHALIEYETLDQAEKALKKLSDERNWRKGLRVRLLHRRSPRSVIRGKSDYDHFDGHSDEDEISASESSENSPRPKSTEFPMRTMLKIIHWIQEGMGSRTWKSRGVVRVILVILPFSLPYNMRLYPVRNTNEATYSSWTKNAGWDERVTMGRGKPVSLLAPVE
ncbi:hypothetical protein GIB67_018238 [Kingdonia uniflora]|uniref:HTH La-type RNA-binding domain-containing protein n=1 Tax=Kingdonia uniflora TaxID=39325 RepID=A0A7J7LEH3_9MAGN|nr:hypothetical protein GIB67_018238 [Kingdonia uniflora]